MRNFKLEDLQLKHLLLILAGVFFATFSLSLICLFSTSALTAGKKANQTRQAVELVPTYTTVNGEALNPITSAEGAQSLVDDSVNGKMAENSYSASYPSPTVRSFRSESITYTVQPQDTLVRISSLYDVSVDTLMKVNNISDAGALGIGQEITIPPQVVVDYNTYYQIIPNSALVYGADSMDFNVNAAVQEFGGYLVSYYDEIDGTVLTGAEIVERVAKDYSVSPKLLLALLEYQSGWVTEHTPDRDNAVYPLGYQEYTWEGLYNQLSWTANILNEGYYYWRELEMYNLVPEDVYNFNAGTAAVQNFFFQLYGNEDWQEIISPEGFSLNYEQMFGDPFYAQQEVVPANLKQPVLQLPFETGVPWVYSGGPHDAWGTGSAWGAIDFAPTGVAGCWDSEQWITAVADGEIIRTDSPGVVIQDLDGDGYEQTGWVILYMHVSSDGKVEPGTIVKAGDHIGHASCEGGVSTGSHVHIARKYNGEWIPAGHGSTPAVLDGWMAYSTGILYDGLLIKDDRVIASCECTDEENMVQR